jgi:hypothetical protein
MTLETKNNAEKRKRERSDRGLRSPYPIKGSPLAGLCADVKNFSK